VQTPCPRSGADGPLHARSNVEETGRSLRESEKIARVKDLLKHIGAQDIASSSEASADVPEATVAARL
jgi:hypothetical protein